MIRHCAFFCLAVLCASAFAQVAGEEDISADTGRLRLVMPAGGGGAVSTLALSGSARNLAGGDGMLLEGFGIGSFYVPNRRLNTRVESLDSIPGRLVFRYSYDCDGPNIRGLKVSRLVEPMPGETSVRVRWQIENAGSEDQWVAPWVRNEVAPGGAFDPGDRIDAPTLTGIRSISTSGYHPAARNWIAATDLAAKETVYAVFNAEETHSFLVSRDERSPFCGLQTAFVPRVFQKGTTWKTQYRLNVVRGLSHVDFATEEFAAQLDYANGRLTLLIAAAKELPPLVIKSSVLAPNGKVWRLDAKRFTANPDTVVRCSFDWGAPADGQYDFLARVFKGDDEAYDLGAGVASPHGGIDTQFVVGQPRSVELEAWTDAPHMLDRGPRTLTRDLIAPGDTAMWIESSLNKVFPEDQVRPSGKLEPTARLSMARNESESIQLVIRPPDGTDIAALSVHVRDLVDPESGAKIPAENVSTHRVGFYPVRVPTHFEGPTGLWPDPLPPLEPFTAVAGRCNPIWITVHAPADTPAGTYSGLVEVNSATLDPVEFWLEVKVHDFQLPDVPSLKTDFGFWADAALDSCKRAGYSGSAQALAEAYLQDAAKHRVTLREPAQFPAESADYPASLRDFEARLAKPPFKGSSTFHVPASLLTTPDQLRLTNEFVVKHDLAKRAFCHIGDEPPQASWPRLFESCQSWRGIAPNIPLMVTTFGLQPFLSDASDIWAAHSPMLDTVNNRVLLERISQGGEVWWYVSHNPPRPYGNLFVDFAAMEHRILFWQAWALGLSGFHYRSVNAIEPERDPWQDQLDVTPANGDGFLVYPGARGPVPSIRWEVIRDGIEDYDYLVLFRARMRELEKTGDHKALIERARKAYNIKELVPDLVSFPRDPEVLEAKREAIAQMIVEMGRALQTGR